MDDSIQTITRSLIGKDVEVDLVSFLPGGWSNENYRIVVNGRHMVLRVKTRPTVIPNSESLYLSQPCAPELIAYDDATGNMLTEWIEGSLLHETNPSPEDIAIYVEVLHGAIPRGITRYDVNEAIKHMYHESASHTPEQSILESDPWTPRSIVGCHNDLNPYNIIKTHDRYFTLDWESAGDNEALFDLAGICHGLQFDDESTEQCIRFYLDRDTDLRYVLQTRRIYQFREHAWALREIEKGNDTKDIRDQVAYASREIQRLTHLLEPECRD